MNSVFLFGVVLKWLADIGAGDVDQDVDAIQARDGIVDRFGIRHVHADGARFMALGAERARMLFELVHGSCGEHSMSSGGGEALCDGQTDAPAGSGDQGCLAGERENVIHYFSVTARLLLRLRYKVMPARFHPLIEHAIARGASCNP